MLYPQRWNHLAPHLAWIERRELHRELHKGHIVAYVFQPHDWDPVSAGSMYGRIAIDLLARLKEAFYEIHLLVVPLLARARTHHILPTRTISETMRLLSDLETLNSTFWESARLVTRVQRGIAELLAFRLFRLDVHHHVGDERFVSDRIFNYVGVFTTDEAMASMLHRLGVPVFGILRGLPKSASRASVVDPVSWKKMVESQAIDSLEAGEWNQPEQIVMGGSTRSVPSARSSHRRPPSPPKRSERSRSPTRESSRQSPARSRSLPRASRTTQSRSRDSGSHRDSSLERVSNYPRYLLHEKPRIADEKRRQHPDAPDRWRPRTWSTDPGHQASIDFKLPDWAPQLPQWLTEIARSVDRSVTREWRLSAVDTPHAVPQDIFSRPLEYMLPPLHLLLKHEKRFLYVIRAWASLRDFWLRRLMDVDTHGLPASTWRKILDNKYHIDKELASWLEARGEPPDPAVDHGDSDVPMMDELTPTQRQTLQKRVSSLASTLRAEIEQHQTQGPVAEVSVRYTRTPVAGEDLPSASTRNAVEPESWRHLMPQVDVFYENRPHCLVLMDETSFSEATAAPTRWHEYWDYEQSRILLFNRASRVSDEHDGPREGEILLHDATLTWHQSRDDICGVGIPSRAMCINDLKDDAGKLVKFSRSTSRAPGTDSTSRSDREGHISETGTVEAGGGQGAPSLRSHRAAPPPDPVYGYARKPPNGFEISQFVIRHHVLAPSDLARGEVRAFLIWELEEAGFRFQLRRTDSHVLKSMGIWTEEIQVERDAIIQQCWGGSDGFVPSGMGIPAQTDPDPRKRVASIYNFWKLVRAWPRVRDVSNLRQYTQYEGLSMEQLVDIEHEVWKFYAQTFYDYFGILPTLPKLMPRNPFVDSET
ncbi:hypothetical protein AURDEDRAFT_173566 [Auricularia subglabra TFB-10046 SS5]|nr:hypothetical protein AURDEDRAFT_173566 [Auricularia subglabra TFB-10046 SS5]